METNNIIKSFELQDDLNSKIWIKSVKDNYVLKSEIREKLLEIAYEFIESLKIDVIVSDVHLTGSLVNYNWSKYSDFDLHIIVNFNQFPKKSLPLYEELFKLKKTIFNSDQNIKIYGYDVEVFIQDENEKGHSSGIFSLISNEWIQKPKKERFSLDKTVLKKKIDQWTDKIDKVLESAKEEKDLQKSKKIISNLKDKLKDYRKIGLEKGGEMSYENLVFKYLRRSGHIEKLFGLKKERLDKELSLNEATTTLGGSFKTDLENGPKNHGARAFGNWQSDNAWDIFSPPGTNVNSYTNGTVIRIHNTGKNSGKVFGTQVTVKGSKGFPDIFYTHLKNVNLNKGDQVQVGDYIGQISEWIGHKGMEHVHIGLPKGNHLRSLLVNSDKIFTGKGPINQPETGDISQVGGEYVNSLLTKADKSKFLSDFMDLAKRGAELKYDVSDRGTIQYNSEVEKLQVALKFLNYDLPKWGIDGKFGPETESAVKTFQKDYKLDETGVVNKLMLQYLFVLLIQNNFEEADVSEILSLKDEGFTSPTVANDKEFYEQILKGIKAPITKGNLKFLYAWRQAEGGKAKNNPFNTTMNLKKDDERTNYNSVGVKNFSDSSYGVEATVKTLLNGYYDCIVDGLRNDLGAERISKMCLSQLEKWGTGGLVNKVLQGGVVNPPSIYSA